MLRGSSVFVWAVIATVQAVDFLYDTVSTTLDGAQCLTNCVNYKCVTDYDDLKESPCNPGNVTAPLYYTAQYRGKKKFCLSACVRYGWPYEWCITRADKNEWDYCSTAVRDEKTLVRGAQFALNDELCIDECKIDETNRHTCSASSKEKLLCNPKKTKDYVRAKTALGFDCVGLCFKQNETYLWCFYGNDSTPQAKKWFPCAPPVSRRKSLYDITIYTYDFESGDVDL